MAQKSRSQNLPNSSNYQPKESIDYTRNLQCLYATVSLNCGTNTNMINYDAHFWCGHRGNDWI